MQSGKSHERLGLCAGIFLDTVNRKKYETCQVRLKVPMKEHEKLEETKKQKKPSF